MIKNILKTALLPLALIAMSLPALAHGKADDRLKITVTATAVDISVILGADVLTDFDSNLDGVLSAAEVQSQYHTLNAYLDTHVRLLDDAGIPVEAIKRNLLVINHMDPDSSSALQGVQIVRRYEVTNPSGLELTVFDHGSDTPDYLVRYADSSERSGSVTSGYQLIAF